MDEPMKTPQEWALYLQHKEFILDSDIEQIRAEALEEFRSQYYNPLNAARAQKIRASLRSQ